MPVRSAGLLLYRQDTDSTGSNPGLHVWIAHMGGPFWARKDSHAWSIPKGEYGDGEVPLEAALREFAEETGTDLTSVPFPLAIIRQAGGKIVEAFAVEGDLDPTTVSSNDFELEWPPCSGRLERFPEVAEARWMALAEARRLMLPSQLPLLDALEVKLKG